MSKIYRVSEFAKRVGCSASALRRWDLDGKFKAKRRVSGQRYYDESDVRKYLNLPLAQEQKTVVYCRVSSHGQKDDLNSQINALETFCTANGIAVDEWIEEIGGGMNFKRKKFTKLMTDISDGKINKLIIAHKDRLTRFGFDYFENVADNNGCDFLVMNQQSLSPEQEMVEDLLAIVHTFSCRLYGLRKYKKELKKDLK